MNFEKYIIIILTSTSVFTILLLNLYKNKKYENFLLEIKSICILVLIIIVIRSFIIEPYRIPSDSMNPTLLSGDFIFVNKFTYGLNIPFVNINIIKINKPIHGDIIIFKNNDGKNYIKRVIGKSGDIIEYQNKKLTVNGILIKQTYNSGFVNVNKKGTILNIQIFEECLIPNIKYKINKYKNINNEYIYIKIKVPDNSYFVLGDNRDNSEDSRYWGFVNNKSILGKAFIKWLSIDYENKNIRWKRFFSWII